jgi:hypothetical protein
MKPSEAAPRPRASVVAIIMVALLVWGGYLAIGAVRFGGSLAAWRGFIVFACTLGFLGLWWLALTYRQRRAHDDEFE